MDLLRSGMPFSLSRLQQEPSTAHHPSEEGCWWHLKLYWNVCPMARCLTTVTECQKLPSPLLCPDVLLGGLGPPQWNATVCCTLKAYGASACLRHHSACLWAHNSVLHLVFQDFCFHAAVMCQVFRQWYLGCTGGGSSVFLASQEILLELCSWRWSLCQCWELMHGLPVNTQQCAHMKCGQWKSLDFKWVGCTA